VSAPGLEDRSVSHNAAFALANQLLTAALTAGLTVFLVRSLGPSDYGIFALAVSVATLVLLPADFGISASTSRFLAERRGEPGAAAGVLRLALGLRLVATVPIVIAMWLLADPIASAYDEPGLAAPLRVMALLLVGNSFLILFRGVFNGLSRTDQTFWMIGVESLIETSASVALVLAGGTAVDAAWGRAAGYCAGGLIGLVLVLRLLGRHVLPGTGGAPSEVPARAIVRYAAALLVIDGAFTLFEQIDILLIGAYLGAASAGVFQAPLRLTTFLHYPGLALATAVAPRLVRREDRGAVQSFELALRLVVLTQMAFACGVAVWAQPITDLALGPDYRESADVLRALAPFIFLTGLAPLVSLAVNYLGEARRRVPIAIGTVLLNAGIDVALIPRIGVVAGAIGTVAAYAVYVPAHLWLCHRILRLDLRALATTFARSLLAGAGLAAALAVWGTSDLSVLQWTGGATTGLGAYLGLLVLTRELTAADLSLLRARFGEVRSGEGS
jgi:O-antigen/teichoic acid export membrane protein